MSVYGSWPSLDGEDHPAPIVYQASNVIPSLSDERGGELGIASIACYITWDGKCAHGVTGHDEMDCEDLDDMPGVWPFLRVSVRPNSRPSTSEYSALREMFERLRRDHAGCEADCSALAQADLLERVAAPEDTVVLDRSQVELLREQLTEWLNRAVTS